MPNVTFINANGKSSTIECDVGTSLMRSSLMHGLSGIVGECSGLQVCGTCHVYVADEFLGTLPEMSDYEDEVLKSIACERLHNSRLACAIIVQPEHENMIVRLPRYQR